MKKIILNKTIAVLLTSIFIFCLIPSSVFSQTNPSFSPLSEIKGFNKSVFDSHFSRADRELNPDRWFAEAKSGISQAIYAWEIIAFDLYDNPLVFEEAKNQIENWSNEELEARFSSWLIGRFFGNMTSNALSELSVLFGETQKNYSWRLDNEGNIIFDDNTGDPLIIRPGEDGREFSQDLQKWRNEAEEHINSKFTSINSSLTGLFPELMAYIPDEYRETMGALIQKTGVLMSENIKREFENIAAREERIFTSRRTRDIWSLRKKTDDEAALIFTERLIAETEEACLKGIEEISAKIEEASAGTGDLALLGEEWFQLYKDQFDRGLKAWEEAEERFFIRRIEWEQESLKLFSTGEESWYNAYNQFEEERKHWELKVKELFQTGELLFKNISDNFEKSIVDAKKEFEVNIEMRIGAGTTKVKALIDMYLISSSAAITAKENINFWLNEHGDIGYYDLNDPDFTALIDKERNKLWMQISENYENETDYFLELECLNNLKELYEQEINTEKDEIAEEESENKSSYDEESSDEISSDKISAEEAYFEYLEFFNERHEIYFQIQDIIDGKIAYLDEIIFSQNNPNLFTNIVRRKYNALIETKKSFNMYASYIEKSLDVRDMIITDYAELFGTGALKDILSANASSEDFFLDEYQLALIKAKALVLYWERKTVIAEAVMKYAEELDAGRMTEAEGIRAWESAKAAYNETLMLYETELKKLHAISYDIFEQQAKLENLAFKMNDAEDRLNKLNNDISIIMAVEISNYEKTSLNDLNSLYDSLVIEYKNHQKTGSKALYYSVLEYGINIGFYEQNAAALYILDILLNGNGAEILSLAELESNVKKGVNSHTDLQIRLAAIDLFADNKSDQLRPAYSTYSGADWYYKAKNITSSQVGYASLFGENLGAKLAEDYKISYRTLLDKRLEFDIKALSLFLKNIEEAEKDEKIEEIEEDVESEEVEESEEAEDFIFAMTDYSPEDKENAEKLLIILTDLKARILSGGDFYTNNNEENEKIKFFITEGSFFLDTEQYLIEYFNDYDLCLGLLDLYNDYCSVSPFLQNEIWQYSCALLSDFFSNYGINTGTNILPDAKNIYSALSKIPGDLLQYTASFLLHFENCFRQIPQWLEVEINNWKTNLINYIAANALNGNIQPQMDTETITQELMRIRTMYDILGDKANSIKYMNDSDSEAIKNEYTQISNNETFYYYLNQITKALDKLKYEANNAENIKHWRQYINVNYLENVDAAIKSATTWNQGVLEDALFSANYYTNRLNDALSMFSQKELYLKYGNIDSLYNQYKNEASKTDSRFNSFKLQLGEIERLGRTYDISKMSGNDIKALLEIQYAALEALENTFISLRSEYLTEAEKFYFTGVRYEEQYNILNKAHDNTEQKRFEYEKQDAIRRWASTAYLNIDDTNPEYYRNNLVKAKSVLTVLSGIYYNEAQYTKDNPEYYALYSDYEQSFNKKLIALEAIEVLLSQSAKDYIDNESKYKNYINSLYKLGSVDKEYKDYTSSESISSWSIKDIITVNNGYLAFSRDESMTLSGIDEAKANDLDNFFNSREIRNKERFETSQFEESLNRLNQRMAVYFNDIDKLKQWSLARDYLLLSLIEANEELQFLNYFYSGMGEADKDGSLGGLQVKERVLYSSKSLYSVLQGYVKKNESICRDAWEELSLEERADLEFYIILTLSGSSDHTNGFSLMYTLDLYEYAYEYVSNEYKYAKEQAGKWWTLWFYNEMKDVNKSTMYRIEPVYSKTKETVQDWTDAIKEILLTTNNYYKIYMSSCGKLDTLEGKRENNQSVKWDDIYNSLSLTEKINDEYITVLKTLWDNIQAQSAKSYQSVPEALTALLNWARIEEETNKYNLEKYRLAALENKQWYEVNYQKAEDAFFAGTINIDTLKTIAENAFYYDASSDKNYFSNMHNVLVNNLSLYLNVENNFNSEFTSLGDEIALLTEMTLESRYMAELRAREIEWNLIRQDISEKYIEWQKNAAKIFENGRADWNTGLIKIEEAFKQWKINFQNEYDRVSVEWTEAYLAGLEDKEKWLEQAASAAYQASEDSFLSLIGTEGERLSRFMDTREPFGIRNAAPEAETLMAELLRTSGISNSLSAFGIMNNIANVASPLVRQGVGGISTWDAALVKAAASDLAKKTNAEIADNETRKLARSASLSAEEAISSIAVNVNSANKNFQESMDNHFILRGLWRKNGNNYIKDIIKGSTLFQPVISDSVTVKGYEYYVTEPISLKTNMDENYLAGLSTVVIRELMGNVYNEINSIMTEIFGNDKESIKIFDTELTDIAVREQSPGKFGAHIGYDPALKYEKNSDNKRESIFYDEGMGELGRLLSDFIYWSVIDNRGSAELSLAPWDKRMWDDQDSSFNAPTLRSTGQVVGAIVGTVVSIVATPFTGGASLAGAVGMMAVIAAINTTDELVFGALDTAFGYKSLDESAFEVGKALLINTATSAASGIFSGFGGAANTIASQGLTNAAVNAANDAAGKVVVQTLMAGAQTAATTFVSSAINGITYNSKDGLGYSRETFMSGINGILTNSLSSAVSTFTSSTLQGMNSGFSMEKLQGFEKANKSNLSKFNNLAGSLAGQGVNYAMGSDFTLNVLNLGLFTNGQVNSGLLELHLGRGGSPTMNIGTNGANVSIDNLAAAYKGALVWDVNNRIEKYTTKNVFDAKITLRAQYGYGDNKQKDQLWDILKNRTDINVDTGEILSAQTANDDGKRTITLTGYQSGMSFEEQMRLAAILGHEAYRDGYKTGDIDGSGNIVTKENSFAELKEASIARLEMGDRINKENNWFFNLNTDFEYENHLLNMAKLSGDYELFEYYLQAAYDNENDYFFQNVDTGGDYQNNKKYSNIPLFNSKTLEKVKEVNDEKFETAFAKYKEKLANEEKYEGDIADFVSIEGTDDELRNKLKTSEKLQEKFGYNPSIYTTIYMYGCMFMSTKYGLESITGNQYDTEWFHDYIKDNNLFNAENLLSNELIAKILNSLSNGEFTVTLTDSGTPNLPDLYKLDKSGDMYIAHLRIRKEGDNYGYHSVMVSSIVYAYDIYGQIIGIDSVNVANPWNSNSYTGKTNYKMSEISRWDIYKVTNNLVKESDLTSLNNEPTYQSSSTLNEKEEKRNLFNRFIDFISRM